MKKRYVVLALMSVVLFFAFGWSRYLWGLWGTWQGDGSLDVLGDSLLDGIIILEFLPNGTGTGVSAQGEVTFTYSIYQRDMLFLKVEDGLTHGIYYSLDGNTLTLDADGTDVIFTKE